MKIPVLHYIDLESLTPLKIAILAAEDAYITNEGGKQYLVEVWQ